MQVSQYMRLVLARCSWLLLCIMLIFAIVIPFSVFATDYPNVAYPYVDQYFPNIGDFNQTGTGQNFSVYYIGSTGVPGSFTAYEPSYRTAYFNAVSLYCPLSSYTDQLVPDGTVVFDSIFGLFDKSLFTYHFSFRVLDGAFYLYRASQQYTADLSESGFHKNKLFDIKPRTSYLFYGFYISSGSDGTSVYVCYSENGLYKETSILLNANLSSKAYIQYCSSMFTYGYSFLFGLCSYSLPDPNGAFPFYPDWFVSFIKMCSKYTFEHNQFNFQLYLNNLSSLSSGASSSAVLQDILEAFDSPSSVDPPTLVPSDDVQEAIGAVGADKDLYDKVDSLDKEAASNAASGASAVQSYLNSANLPSVTNYWTGLALASSIVQHYFNYVPFLNLILAVFAVFTILSYLSQRNYVGKVRRHNERVAAREREAREREARESEPRSQYWWLK